YPVCVSLQCVEEFPRRHMPYTNGIVARCAGNHRSIRGKGYDAKPICALPDLQERCLLFAAPDAKNIIIGSRGEQRTIGRVGDAANPTFRLIEFLHKMRAGHIPKSNPAIEQSSG